MLTIDVVARSVDDVDELIGNLEGTGSFSNLLSVEEHFNDGGDARGDSRRHLRAAAGSARGSHPGGEEAMTLLQRILREKRSLILPLFVALLVNIAVYALVVRPLGVRSATAAERAQAAAASLKPAERDRDAARALVAGKTLAEQELATFYDKVLPADLSAARRMTYAALPALAQQGQRQVRRQPDRRSRPVKNQRLGRLRISMVLEGDYDSVRQFIYELETDAGVRDHRRRDAGAERPRPAARAVARALGVLPDWAEWQLSASARLPSAWSLWCWRLCCTVQ